MGKIDSADNRSTGHRDSREIRSRTFQFKHKQWMKSALWTMRTTRDNYGEVRQTPLQCDDKRIITHLYRFEHYETCDQDSNGTKFPIRWCQQTTQTNCTLLENWSQPIHSTNPLERSVETEQNRISRKYSVFSESPLLTKHGLNYIILRVNQTWKIHQWVSPPTKDGFQIHHVKQRNEVRIGCR